MRSAIFYDDAGWQVHAYCLILMDNHFYLVVETPRSNLKVQKGFRAKY